METTTIWHPSEEDLILHFYGENLETERRVEAHLGECAVCRNAFSEITETLKLVDLATVADPGPAFERAMWARVRPGLPQPHPLYRPRSKAAPFAAWGLARWLVPVAGLAAVIVAMVVAANRSSADPAGTSPVTTAAPAPELSPAAAAKARERVLLYAAGDHFQQAEIVLVELMNGPDSNPAGLEFERTMATDLVASGRLYRETARENGDGQLVKALEDLESVLVEVARSPEQVKRKDLKTLRARINHDSLLFKVRAVSNEIRERQRALSVVTLSEGSL